MGKSEEDLGLFKPKGEKRGEDVFTMQWRVHGLGRVQQKGKVAYAG